MDQQAPNYWGVVPAIVRYSTTVTPGAKVLYAEISALTNMRGICWATNKYLAKLYNVQPTRISEWVKQLEDAGFIRTKNIDGGYRGISVLIDPSGKSEGGLLEKQKHNNTVTNNKNKQKFSASSNDSFGESVNADGVSPRHDDHATQLLEMLIGVINPKEKPTDERLRKLRARMKEYTSKEIMDSAKVFSQSEWHIENKQMSIDNLLAPSKFGRWFAQRADGEMSEEEKIRTQNQRIRERMGS